MKKKFIKFMSSRVKCHTFDMKTGQVNGLAMMNEISYSLRKDFVSVKKDSVLLYRASAELSFLSFNSQG